MAEPIYILARFFFGFSVVVNVVVVIPDGFFIVFVFFVFYIRVLFVVLPLFFFSFFRSRCSLLLVWCSLDFLLFLVILSFS